MVKARVDWEKTGNMGEDTGSATSSYVNNFFPIGSNVPTVDDIYNNETAFYFPKDNGTSFQSYSKKLLSVKDSVGNTVSGNDLKQGTYTVSYEFYSATVISGADTTIDIVTATYTIIVIKNRYPLKKWTVTDVVNRCLELIEPLKVDENPRFVFDGVRYANGKIVNYSALDKYRPGSQAEKYDKILAPEFAMTKQTLREQLKQVGGYIHAEPRLRDGVIYFDEYGKNTYSNISTKKYISCQTSWDVNEYCTGLDSQADNLVNRLDYAQGVIIEPFIGAYQTVRTETTTVRITDTDTDAKISTSRPIMSIEKVLVRYVERDEDYVLYWSEPIDITAFLFENSEYQNLSSFSGAFPYAKEYALKYTQGEKDITGLFYKSPDVTGGAATNYAIVKIINSFGGNFNTSIANDAEYPLLSFQVSYIPIFSERVRTNKAIRVEGIPRNLSYNQSSNLVETRYYGENLKGVVARLGNIEKTYTYKVAFLSDIPKAGDLFDKNYYISAVSVEIQPFFIKVTVGLSKDFNRLSEYIGISSNLRMYEISEKQAFQRDTVYTDYLVITDNNAESINATDNQAFMIGEARLQIKAMFDGTWQEDYTQVSQVITRSLDINRNDIHPQYRISLPVISSALGNQMTFSFNFEDNYSAGQKSGYISGSNGVSGYFGQYVPYCDYYGRIYYLYFEFARSIEDYSGDINTIGTDKFQIEHKFPITSPQITNVTVTNSVGYGEIRYRKDSREVPSLTYQLNIVADKGKEDFVIGSGFARNCSLVNGKPITGQDGNQVALKVYIFNDRLPLYEKIIDIDSAVAVIDMPNISLNVPATETNLVFDNIRATANGKSWAIVTPKTTKSITVEDEDGTVTTQQIVTGQELILGKNVEIINGAPIIMPKFYFVHNIYD